MFVHDVFTWCLYVMFVRGVLYVMFVHMFVRDVCTWCLYVMFVRDVCKVPRLPDECCQLLEYSRITQYLDNISRHLSYRRACHDFVVSNIFTTFWQSASLSRILTIFLSYLIPLDGAADDVTDVRVHGSLHIRVCLSHPLSFDCRTSLL